jgi:hypothetical protein
VAWANPNAPNLPDFYLFLLNEVQIPSSALPVGTIPSSPSGPSLTPSATGGSLATGTVYVVVTYVSAYGETPASSEVSTAVTGPTGSVSVSSPAAVTNATGFNVYAAGTASQEVLINSAPVQIGTPYVIGALSTGLVIPPTVNTTGWTWPSYAMGRAQRLVLNIPAIAGADYTLAVYNCATHILLNIAPDTSAIYKDGVGFFAYMRNEFDLNEPASGVISSSSDQGTSSSFTVPHQFENFTVSDLDFFRTPWGRFYIGYAQDFGAISGLT